VPSLTTPNTCAGRKSALLGAPSTVEPINAASTVTGWNVLGSVIGSAIAHQFLGGPEHLPADTPADHVAAHEGRRR